MGGEYPKGGDIPMVGGGVNLLEGGSPMTTAWANSTTYLTILSCLPPKKYEFAPQIPPPNF